MVDLVLFSVGSSLVVDYVESARRKGLVIAGVRNFDGPVFSDDGVEVFDTAALTGALLAQSFIVPLFTPGNRQAADRQARNLGFAALATLVDPTSIVPGRLLIGAGTYINAGCTLGAASEVGRYVVINRGAVIGHHVRLDDFVSIGPGVVTGGHVSVGRGSVVGTGAVILPEIAIGKNAVVGAGAVVTRDVPDQTMVVGNPARVMRDGVGGYRGMAVD
jgi:sugar O-acyltransferase (sialic acid O-acetyltransferase NeuD family)